MTAAHEWITPIAVAVSAVAGAVITGRFAVRREREARVASEPRDAVDGFDKLTGRLDQEVARLSQDLALVRAALAAALREVDECERARRELSERVAWLELQLVRAGVLDRRHRDTGPPDGGPERRQT